jgi:hypothetical protein
MKTDEKLGARLRRASRMVRLPEDPLERLYGRRAVKRHRERLAAAAVAVALVAVAVGGSLFALGGVWGGRRTGTGAGWTPDRALELRPGQYFYLKSTTVGEDASRSVQETWWAPDGSGELRFRTNRPDKYVPYPPEGVYGNGEFPLPYQEDVSSLSSDPGNLGEQVRERADRDSVSMWREVLRLLDVETSPQALPELRAALFEVATRFDGVVRDDAVQDPVGREAVALSFVDREECVDGQCHRWVLFFSPGTHQLMAESVGPSAEPVPFRVIESAIVDSNGAAPTDDQLLFPRASRQLRPMPGQSSSLP